MTRLRLATPGALAAMAFSLAGGSLSPAQSGSYQQYYAQAPTAQYGPTGPQQQQHPGQYPSTQGQYQPPTGQNVQPSYTPPVSSQATPYTAARAPEGDRVAQQPQQQYGTTQSSLPNAQPTTVAPGASSYQLPNYQAALPNYQAPAPGSRYAMMQDDSAAAAPEQVPPPPSAPHSTGRSVPPVEANAAGDWEGYVQAPPSGAGYPADGGYGVGYKNHDPGGADCTTEDCDYGTFGGGGHVLGGRLFGQPSSREWFFGAYSLFMSRDNPSYERFAVLVDTPAMYPYYPMHSETILSTEDIEPDYQWGAEVRFGSTFGRAAGCEPGCGPRPYAWEVVYWGLAEDDQMAWRTDAMGDSDRIYTTIDYSGIRYDRDDDGNHRDMNDYWDYQMPIEDPMDDPDAVRVLGIRVRSSFSAQNLELNFIRFPLAGCAPCDPCAPPRFTLNGVCGVRYFKMDEDLEYGVMFTDPTVGGDPPSYTGFPRDDDNNLFHDISTDNELVGFQIGSNMNWLIGCKWSAFCDTQFGIYGNRISSYQRVFSGGGGDVTWDGSGETVEVRSSKTDVSFLSEARMGFGYQVGYNCRLTAAYRVLALTGVALAGEQIPSDWSNAAYVGQIDSNDSLILHGLQMGAEWKY